MRPRRLPHFALCTLHFALCTLLATAHGQCPGGSCAIPPPATRHAPPEIPASALVRIRNKVGNVADWGSGTIVWQNGPEALVLTCWHIFRDGTGQITVVAPDGQQQPATLVAVDRDYDLAGLRIANWRGELIPIACDPPRPGQPVRSCGRGGDGRGQAVAGQALRYVRTDRTTTISTLVASGGVRGGDSGGPMLNARGELVGVIWGTIAGETYGTQCGEASRFVEEACLRRLVRSLRPSPSRPPGLTPAPAPQTPVPAAPPGADLADRLAAAEREIDVLQKALAAIEARPVAMGPPGPAGPAGTPGKDGPPGKDGKVPTGSITIQTIDETGKVLQSAEARLGETIQLRLVPVPAK